MQIGFFLDDEAQAALFEEIRTRGGVVFHYGGPTAEIHEIVEHAPKGRQVLMIARAGGIDPTPEATIPRSQLLGDMGFLFEPIEFTTTDWERPVPQPGRLWLNGLEKPTISLYNALSRHIRRHCRKDAAGFWRS